MAWLTRLGGRLQKSKDEANYRPKKRMIDMKKMITIGAMVLFFILAASSAHALVWFGPTDTFVTLDGRFNYTFLVNMSFSQAGNGDDWIMLNYENITIIPHGTGTGTGTINSWTDTMRDITVCTNDTEVNISFVNLTASTDIYIVEDNTWYLDVTDNTNYTFNATAGCKQVLIYDIKTEISSSSSIYPSSKDANIFHNIIGSLTTGTGTVYNVIIIVVIIVLMGIALFYMKSYSKDEVSTSI